MRIFVNGNDITQSVYAQKRILLDTMILCYAHDRLSPYHDEASLIIKASANSLIKSYTSYQNLLEFYSIMTGKRVKNPLRPREAAELCTIYAESVSITKLLPTPAMYREMFESAEDLSVVDGDVFDCILAYTARGNTDTVWTENVRHFKKYSFIGAENPFDWKWEERQA